MPINMEYCQFENTANALWECMETLEKEGGFTAAYENRKHNPNEMEGLRNLFERCLALVDEYGGQFEIWEQKRLSNYYYHLGREEEEEE